MTERLRHVGAAVLPALLALFPAATVERVCACVEEFLDVLQVSGGEGAAECYERHEAALGPLARILYDVIVVAVIRVAPAEAIDVLSVGSFELRVLDHAVLSVRSARERLSPRAEGRIKNDGGPLAHDHPQHEAVLAQRMSDDDVERRAVVVAVCSTIDPDTRLATMDHVELWLRVMQSVFTTAKRAAPKSETPKSLVEASKKTLWENDDNLTDHCPTYAAEALAGAWFGRGCSRVWRALEDDYSSRNEVILQAGRALEDIAHARAIFGLVTSEGGA